MSCRHPGEASPDGPPALVGHPLKSLSCQAATYHSLAWNVADPEGGRLTGLWSVDNGDSSMAGTIFTPVTGGLPATWLAPNIAGDYTVRATFIDQGGQETEYSQSISVAAVEDAPKALAPPSGSQPTRQLHTCLNAPMVASSGLSMPTVGS